jgi:Rhs element Vgr protein
MIATEIGDLVTVKILLGSGSGAPTNQEVSGGVNVLSISVFHELNKIPTATVKIADGELSDASFPVGDSGEFALGKSIDIQAGYNSQDNSLFKGIISANSHSLQAGISQLQLTCKHDVVKMTVGKKNRHFNDLSDSDIVETILQENGITDLDIPSFGSSHEQLLQANVSDWDFILSRIDSNGMACRIEGTKFVVFKPDSSSDSVLTLTFGADIFSFQSESDIRSQVAEVKFKAWDHANQTVLEASATDAIGDNAGNFSISDMAGIHGQSFEVGTPSHLKTEGLQSFADAKKQKMSLSKIRGKIIFSGNSAVKPGDWIELVGVGDQFTGKVFVSAVRHDIYGGNWVTEASIGWETDFFTEKVNPSAVSAESGQFSRIQGLHIGIVTDIMDPLGEGRVRVRLPMVNAADAGLWARVATLDAGNNRGTFFRPEIDDEVIVGFMNDDPSFPVLLGMLHSSAKPTPIDPEDSNDKKGYVSRSEIKITIHDGDRSIVIETPGGRKFTMDDEAGIIQVEDAVGNILTMNDSGITCESPQDISVTSSTKISLAAPEIEIKADMNIAVEGGAGLSVKSGGTSDIEGAMVNIKGSLVKIN